MTATHSQAIPYAAPDVSAHALILGDPAPVSRKWLAFWALAVTAVYALLWSRYWYPLSDSSLYLSLARSLATGRGFTFQGDVHRLVPPLAPFIYSLLMRCGAGIGGIQAALIVFMLLAHALCFLTLRRWVSERLALSAVLVTALSYWVFYNAFAVMSEPPCLAMFWGGLLLLSGVRAAPTRGRRWVRVVSACLLLLGATECRMAAVFLVPGSFVALFITGAAVERWPTRIGWGIVFLIVFAIALAYFRWPNKVMYYIGMGPPPPTVVVGQAPPAGINAEYGMDDAGNTVREGRYKSIWLYGVKKDFQHLVTDVPALAGEWVAEGLAMPAVVLFRMPHGIVRESIRVLAIIVFAVSLVGIGALVRRRQWWLLGLLPYFLVFWLQWGTRIKPRYMAPIAPVLFIVLWAGTTAVIAFFRRAKSVETETRIGRWVAGVILAGVIVGNAPAWAMEFYLRHGTKADFYDVARRGAMGDLVDIGAYLQQHMGDKEIVWVNVGANRRIIHFLSGRTIDIPTASSRNRAPEVAIPSWTEPVGSSTGGKLLMNHLAMFLNRLSPQARFAVAYCERVPWPEWHWPINRRPLLPGDEWWRLYERGADGKFHQVVVPRSRDYVQSIPRAGV